MVTGYIVVRVNFIKLFFYINAPNAYARVFVPTMTLQPSLIFASEDRAYPLNKWPSLTFPITRQS